MRLCFGIFAMVLNRCRTDIQQAALVARIAKCIDQHSSYIAVEDRYKTKNEWEIMGDDPATSKLLHCKRNFVYEKDSATDKPAIEDVIKNFEAHVAPFIIEDKKPAVIFALLDIIRQDKILDFEMKDGCKKYLGADKQELLKRNEFIFSDFLSRVLLYTVYGGVDNCVGKEYIRLITKSYISKVADLYTYEYEWSQSTQTLTLTFATIYMLLYQAMQRYEIHKFVEEIDPTVMMDIKWIEQCDDYLKDTESNIWKKFASTEVGMLGLTIRKVQEFAQTLDDYTKYLGINMRPIAECPELFVPLYRDENVKWALPFEAKVRDYRQQLISIYQEIYTHMLFA